MKRELVAQGRIKGSNPLLPRLVVLAEQDGLDHLDTAMAYVTVSGLEALFEALGGPPATSRWIVGLDDAITQPGAIDRLIALPGARVRLARFSQQGRRFHPKFIRLSSSSESSKALVMIGSSNLTLAALKNNGEAVAFLVAESKADVDEFAAPWNELWRMGQAATPASITSYRARYEAARKARKALIKLGVEPPEPAPAKPGQDLLETEALEISPAAASTAWTDIGSAMGNGREVELPRALMPFFGVTSSTLSPQLRRFELTNGSTLTLSLILRPGNAMWRIHFTTDVPGAGDLRIRENSRLLRSTKAAVFAKGALPGTFAVSFVGQESAAYKRLTNRSRAVHALGRTLASASGRSYGFF